MGLYYQPISAVCLKLSVGTERQSHKAHPSRFIEVLYLRSSLIQYKHCGPKINTFSRRYGICICDSVSFMIVSQSLVFDTECFWRKCNLFGRSDISVFSPSDIHMSQTTGIVCLFSGHSSYLMQYKKTSVLNVKVTMQADCWSSTFEHVRVLFSGRPAVCVDEK